MRKLSRAARLVGRGTASAARKLGGGALARGATLAAPHTPPPRAMGPPGAARPITARAAHTEHTEQEIGGAPGLGIGDIIG